MPLDAPEPKSGPWFLVVQNDYFMVIVIVKRTEPTKMVDT
jgi:hypothetical protein